MLTNTYYFVVVVFLNSIIIAILIGIKWYLITVELELLLGYCQSLRTSVTISNRLGKCS